MNDRYFDLGNLAINNELDTDAEVTLVDATSARSPRAGSPASRS